MATTDAELERLQKSVEKKRERVLVERVRLTERTNELSNDITAVQLQAEEARLDAELATLANQSKVTSVREGASAPLDAAREELRNAVASQEGATANADANAANVAAAKEAAADETPKEN